MLARLLQLHPKTYGRLVRLSKEAERDGAYRVAKRLQAVVLNSEGRTSGELAWILKAPRSKVSALPFSASASKSKNLAHWNAERLCSFCTSQASSVTQSPSSRNGDYLFDEDAPLRPQWIVVTGWKRSSDLNG